jgi:FKBP-type peptidyl-prolyl cis-trans isomerase FklB
MKLSNLSTIVLFCSLSAPVSATETLDFTDESARINYSLGYQIGGDFKRQGVEMDADAVVQGIRDALSDAEPQMDPAEMNKTLVELKRKVVAEQNKRRKETEYARLAAGKQFLEENASKDGVITTDSGLQYRVIKEGTGKSPGPADQVTVHYKGTLIDGKEFDSSYKKGKPATFRLDGVIKGWAEGLQLMKEGGKSQLFVPAELAYGSRGPLGNYTLIFDVELISVGEPAAAAPAAAPAKEEARDEATDGQ